MATHRALNYLMKSILPISTTAYLFYLNEKNHYFGQYKYLLQDRRVAEALVKDEHRKRLHSVNTNVYVWGEGQQVDSQQDYSNFTPKKLKPFRGKNKPNVVDVAFGWYHEAYIDSNGKLYVCKKPKMTSVKVEEIDEKDRTDLVEITTIPGKPKVRQVAFTRQRMFVLTEKGETFVFKISEKMPDFDEHFNRGQVQIQADLQMNSPIHIKDLKNLKMIACGSDHFIALTNEGQVYAMGDDTFGQCGQGGEGRSTTAPFFEKRFGKPVKVEIPEKVIKVVCGYRHTLAITEKGNLYGWGYNNQQQLSHSEEYASEENPLHAILNPTPIKKGLEGKQVIDAACGEEFSVILVKNISGGIQEVYATGNNLRGQLGINRLCHVADLTLIEDISGFVDQYKDRPLNISHLSCGRKHCIATFDYGAFFIWGDNEFGQLGDKKRRFLESPFPKGKYERKHNVENVICGIDSCAVIVEDLEDKQPEKKKKKKEKRTIKKSQMITNFEDLKAINEAQVAQKSKQEIEPKKNLGERLREKWHGKAYSKEVPQQEQKQLAEKGNEKESKQ